MPTHLEFPFPKDPLGYHLRFPIPRKLYGYALILSKSRDGILFTLPNKSASSSKTGCSNSSSSQKSSSPVNLNSLVLARSGLSCTCQRLLSSVYDPNLYARHLPACEYSWSCGYTCKNRDLCWHVSIDCQKRTMKIKKNSYPASVWQPRNRNHALADSVGRHPRVTRKSQHKTNTWVQHRIGPHAPNRPSFLVLCHAYSIDHPR